MTDLLHGATRSVSALDTNVFDVLRVCWPVAVVGSAVYQCRIRPRGSAEGSCMEGSSGL